MKRCLLALLVALSATPLAAQVQITGTVGEIVDTSPGVGPGFEGQEGYFLRYVGNPAPTGFSHDYQWADPYIETVSPETTPVMFAGTLDLSTRTIEDGYASFIGLHDLTSHELGYGGGGDATATWTDGAYIYVRNYANGNVEIGPSDGNAGGGEYVQRMHTILAADIPPDGIIDVTFVIDGTADPTTCGDLPEAEGDAGCMTLTIGALEPLTDSYGDKLAPESAVPEFSNGGIPGWDASHSVLISPFLLGGGVSYDLTVSPVFFGNPTLSLVKTADTASYSMVGEIITYTFTVTNTGDASLFNVTITDPLPGLSPISCPGGHPIASLPVAATIDCTATYEITQADLDNGSVSNTALVTAECVATIDGTGATCAEADDGETIERDLGQTTFRVEKDFSDDNPAGVTVQLECNTGLPLQQSGEVHDPDSNPGPGQFSAIEFVVSDFEPGTLNCDIDEVIPDGYVATYTAGATTSVADDIFADETGCHYTLIEGGQFTCGIFNQLQPVDVVVEKQWIDDNPDFQLPQVVEVTLECNAPITGGFQCFGGEGTGNNCREQFIDPTNPGEFEVLPHFAGTTCSATEEPIVGVLTDESDCQEMIVFPGQGDSCVIVNTRVFAGIPTLNQYGLMLLTLLMLGIGAVAYRRFA